MLSIVCDSCKKAIPRVEWNDGVVYVFDKTLCKKCEKKLREEVAEEMRKHRTYEFSVYKNTYVKALQKQCR
jgi:hypothetical protein